MAVGTGGAASPVSRHEHYRATTQQWRRFRKIAGALGVDPTEAERRTSDLLDADLDPNQTVDAEVFLQVLAEMVDEGDTPGNRISQKGIER